MSVGIQDILGQPYLTSVIQEIKTGIPDLLPPEFASTTERIFGDRARSVRVSGSRQLARRNEYGAAPRRLDLKGLSQTDLKFLHFGEEIQLNIMDYINLRAYDSYSGNEVGKQEIDRQIEQFAVRFDNQRVAARYSLLANGKIWYDVDGNMLPSSSSAVVTVDPGIPAGNQNQIGGLITASWATASTPIIKNILNVKDYALRLTGYPLGMALYGKNIPGYFGTNTEAKEFLVRNPSYNQRYTDTGEIPDGVCGLKWRRMSGAFYNNSSDAAVLPWGDDMIVFTPEVSKDWWTMVEGSHPIPTSFQPTTGGPDMMANVMANMKFEYGKAAYAYLDPASLMPVIRGMDTMIPWLKNPNVVFIADVTP